jgi:1-aminocyclopropane-1-carboxylate deaminase/D-cysteine desulfhydrase-like pyridoxal-dependent ACC family enzyme
MAVTAPAQLPRTRLAVLPTPLVEAPALAEALRLAGPLYVKRDDLTGFAMAGNKARQLEMLVAEAVDRGADVLLTGGSVGSNFVAAAAAAAAYAGLRCELVIAGPPRSGSAHPNLAAAMTWGAQVRFTDDLDRGSVDDLLPTVAREFRAAGATVQLVPRGGANAIGASGFRLAANELADQLKDRCATPAVVVVATGSGGTQAGLVAGAVALGRPFRVAGASVSRPAPEMAGRVLALAREVAARCGEPDPADSDVQVIEARGPGHGMASPEGAAAAAIALRAAGVVLDPVYSAKALAALPRLVGSAPAVFWHTGGLADAIAEMQEGGAR